MVSGLDMRQRRTSISYERNLLFGKPRPVGGELHLIFKSMFYLRSRKHKNLFSFGDKRFDV
jgi:hypothetical protein